MRLSCSRCGAHDSRPAEFIRNTLLIEASALDAAWRRRPDPRTGIQINYDWHRYNRVASRLT
jgi:hypothetical protein